MSYDYRSSDLDFAMFLEQQDIRQLIQERWAERHPEVIRTAEFNRQVAEVEALVSPTLRARSTTARRARFRNGSTTHLTSQTESSNH